jgi:hypothetical protein
MHRREVLQIFGATAAVAMVPKEAIAAWARVASGVRLPDGLSETHLALVGAVADTILPRSSSPSATDVAVPDFVNVIVTGNYTDAERTAFVEGLDAIDAHVKSNFGAPFTELPPARRGDAIGAVEALTDRRAEPSRTYWRLKGLVIHGYFTSERVMKTVLHYEIMPGSFNGNAPMAAAAPVVRPAPTKRHDHG